VSRLFPADEVERLADRLAERMNLSDVQLEALNRFQELCIPQAEPINPAPSNLQSEDGSMFRRTLTLIGPRLRRSTIRSRTRTTPRRTPPPIAASPALGQKVILPYRLCQRFGLRLPWKEAIIRIRCS
jgi:hypothetical protein